MKKRCVTCAGPGDEGANYGPVVWRVVKAPAHLKHYGRYLCGAHGQMFTDDDYGNEGELIEL